MKVLSRGLLGTQNTCLLQNVLYVMSNICDLLGTMGNVQHLFSHEKVLCYIYMYKFPLLCHFTLINVQFAEVISLSYFTISLCLLVGCSFSFPLFLCLLFRPIWPAFGSGDLKGQTQPKTS